MGELPSVSHVAAVASSRARRLFIVALIAGAAGLVILGPIHSWSRWGHPAALLALAGLACASVVSEVNLKRQTHLLADDAIVTLILVVWGPVPAALVLLGHDLAARLLLRRLPLASAGAWASYVSYPWAMIAGAAVLHLGHATEPTASAFPAVLTAGFTWLLVNWTIARGLPMVLWRGHSLVAVAREEFVGSLPQHGVLVLVAGACAALVPVIGLAWLLPLLAPTVLLAAVAVPYLARSRDISRLSHADATVLYVRVLAARRRTPRRERRLALAAAQLLARGAHPGGATVPTARLLSPPTRLPVREGEEWAAWSLAQETTDPWGRSGEVTGYPRRALIPEGARLLAVAREWAMLTAAGGPELPQAEALLALELLSATRLDPAVVTAASAIVTTEAQFADLASFAPRIDLLPLPRSVRLTVLPWALRSCQPVAA